MFLVTSDGLSRDDEYDKEIRCFEAFCLTREIAEEYVKSKTQIYNNHYIWHDSTCGGEFKVEEIEPISKI